MSDTERLIAEFEPDVIHVHNLLAADALDRLQKRAAVVQSVHNHTSCTHGHRYFGPGEACHLAHSPACLTNSLLRNCGHRRIPMASLSAYRRVTEHLETLRRSDAVIAYSDYVAGDLRRNGVPGAHVLRLFVHDRPTVAPTETSERRILFAGRVVPEKGLGVLLHALVHVNGTLEVHGDGWGLKRCRQLCGRLNLEDRVEFHGWGSECELDDAYARGAVVAVPSIWPEPFGMVGLEAMIHHRPVVASAVGGIPEWLAHDTTGCLVNPGDPMALAQALARLLDRPDLRHEMGRNGRLRALTEFTAERHLNGLRAVYAGAVEHWHTALGRSPA